METILIDLAKNGGPSFVALVLFVFMMKKDISNLRDDLKANTISTQANTKALAKLDGQKEGNTQIISMLRDSVQKNEKDIDEIFKRLRLSQSGRDV